MKTLFLALTSCLLSACSVQRNVVIVSNPLDFERTEIVTAPQSTLASLSLKEGESFVVKVDGKQVPYQILSSGELIFEANIGALGSKLFTIKKGKLMGVEIMQPTAFKARAYCKVEPQRFNDFLWENDKVAFRAYQTELMAKDGPSNGFDFFSKTTDELIIDEWMENYLVHKKSYHVNHGTGCDCYKVGRTLGCGAMAPYINGAIVLGENFISAEILENGPLRMVAKLVYNPLEINGASVVESRIITLDAGSQLSKIEVAFEGAPTMEVAAGIALKNEKAGICTPESMNLAYSPVIDIQKGFIAYEEVADMSTPERNNGIIYTAVLFPTPLKEAKVEDLHLLAIAELPAGKTIQYYQGGATSLRRMTKESWIGYLENFSRLLQEPLVVK